MSATTRAATIAQLLDTLYETLRYFDQPEQTLNRSYAPGKWTMREILVHLSDCEAVYVDRLRRLAVEERPVLQAFDQDRWAGGLFYARRELGLAKSQYETARREIVELARVLEPAVDARAGTHSEAGTRTFGQVLAQSASHNAHHLEQLRAIAEGNNWKKA